MSYMQLVEVAFVASFRQHGLKMQTIRKAREYLAQRFGVEFPFAQRRLISDGIHIMVDLQDLEPDPDLNLLVLADMAGQEAWPEAISNRYLQFEYLDELAVRWYPRGQSVPVIIDPRISFGAPTVDGIPTWAIRGRSEAGETPEEIAEDFELPISLVQHALAFEQMGGTA